MSIGQHIERPGNLAWFRSSCSGTNGGDCVEVAAGAGAVHVRDSKTVGDGPVPRIHRDGWTAFVALAAVRRHRVPECDDGPVRVLEVTWTSPSPAVGPRDDRGCRNRAR
ncbi:hypothetical protein APS67_000465 [Streptomyces sp. AVP053U2]|nr:hypothetical protein APS67_000465 [Streptomyces sp. AVP053U2]